VSVSFSLNTFEGTYYYKLNVSIIAALPLARPLKIGLVMTSSLLARTSSYRCALREGLAHTVSKQTKGTVVVTFVRVLCLG
jgi:hypothetical protein